MGDPRLKEKGHH